MKIKIQEIDVEKLLPATYNPRKMSEQIMQDLIESIREFGLPEPLVVNKDFTIIGGHQRLEACKRLGWKQIPCVFVDLRKAQEKKLNLRLNKVKGEFDIDLLTGGEFDRDLLKELGFTDEELRSDFSSFNEEDKEGSETAKPDQLNMITLNFIPEDYELFLATMDTIKVNYNSPVKSTMYGLKVIKLIKELKK